MLPEDSLGSSRMKSLHHGQQKPIKVGAQNIYFSKNVIDYKKKLIRQE